MTAIEPPTERECLRCGRVEHWDSQQGTWMAADTDGTNQMGQPHCVHEWDITGNYNPIADTE
jgi:hypothetical protein